MRSRSVAFVAAAAVALLAGCATSPPGPEGWLPKAPDAPADPYGGWVEVKYVAPDAKHHRMEGELLAIQDGRLYVVDAAVRRSVALDSVASATLGYFEPHAGAIAGMTVFGVLSTLSNGYLLVFTAPAWMVVGLGASAGRADDAIVHSRNADWEEFRAYARFPRGIPPGFEPARETPLRLEGPQGEPLATARMPLNPPRGRAFWTCLGVGFGGVEDASSGLSFLGGVNLAYKWFMVGTRITSVEWSVTTTYPSDQTNDDRRLYDLPLLVGLRGNYRGIHATISAGPAAYARSAGDLVDFQGSFAAQGELFVFATDDFGFGALVGANWNDLADYYVVCLGVAIGGR